MFNLPCYTVISKCNVCCGYGGLVIYISDQHTCTNVVENINLSGWKQLFIEIKDLNSCKYIIGNVYRPPGNWQHKWTHRRIYFCCGFISIFKLFMNGDFNLDLLKIDEMEYINNYFTNLTSSDIIHKLHCQLELQMLYILWSINSLHITLEVYYILY